MKNVMWAIYYKQSKLPLALFTTKWRAADYIKHSIPSHVKIQTERVELVKRTETAYDLFKHEYKHLIN